MLLSFVFIPVDAWSTLKNDSIVGATIEDYILDMVDSCGEAHTSEYLGNQMEVSAKLAKEEFNCNVASVVTDNAANCQ